MPKRDRQCSQQLISSSLNLEFAERVDNLDLRKPKPQSQRLPSLDPGHRLCKRAVSGQKVDGKMLSETILGSEYCSFSSQENVVKQKKGERGGSIAGLGAGPENTTLGERCRADNHWRLSQVASAETLTDFPNASLSCGEELLRRDREAMHGRECRCVYQEADSIWRVDDTQMDLQMKRLHVAQQLTDICSRLENGSFGSTGPGFFGSTGHTGPSPALAEVSSFLQAGHALPEGSASENTGAAPPPPMPRLDGSPQEYRGCCSPAPYFKMAGLRIDRAALAVAYRKLPQMSDSPYTFRKPVHLPALTPRHPHPPKLEPRPSQLKLPKMPELLIPCYPIGNQPHGWHVYRPATKAVRDNPDLLEPMQRAQVEGVLNGTRDAFGVWQDALAEEEGDAAAVRRRRRSGRTAGAKPSRRRLSGGRRRKTADGAVG
uniref:Uncharacterized protein n=1 Tax=Tetraselmis sp. GSL018 TaxID=582737 RepID=A0A061SE27_9CHLO